MNRSQITTWADWRNWRKRAANVTVIEVWAAGRGHGSRRRNVWILSTALAVLGVGPLPGSEPAAAEILPKVQLVLGGFLASLPSFVCTETVDSQTLASGNVTKNTHVVSSFTGIQQRSRNMTFTETRKKLSIDGTPVPSGKDPILKGVFHFGGGFSSVLAETFSAESASWQRYKIAGTDRIAGEDCIIVDMETDEATSKLALDWFGHSVHPSASGRAWISRGSMEVLKLERHYSGLPRHVSLHVSVDYARVVIGANKYLMPGTVRAWTTLTGSRRRETSNYSAKYSDYRKFEVASDIKYQ